MNILRRVEMLEEELFRHRGDVGYKLVLLEKGEGREEGVIRSGLADWPSDRLVIIRFVSAQEKFEF